MLILAEAKLLGVAVPVPYPDEELLHMISCRINAQVAIVHVKLQPSVVHKRPHLWSDINTAIAGSVFRCHQLTALRRRRASEEKHEPQTTDPNCE